MAIPLNLTGVKFGRLTPINIAYRRNAKIYWRCSCECGCRVEVKTESLRSGNTKSCGCLDREKTSLRFKTHGETKTPLYYVWGAIKARCQNPKDRGYNRYGGRGIRICDEWAKSYQSFRDWANNSGYKDGLQIDRVDNDGPYNPKNCRWCTQQENVQNSTVAKLDRDQVLEIRSLFSQNPNINMEALAFEYNVVRATIYNVTNRKTWKNL